VFLWTIIKATILQWSNVGSEFNPMEVKIEEKKRVAWCTCKYSKNKPYCDGTHMQDYIQQT
jgi:CDGSH-type Zn-finger protein